MFLRDFFNIKVLRKVPEITLIFWIIKLLTTAMGESTSDYLVKTIDPVIAVAIAAVGFSIAIILQFWVKKYIPWVYWLAVSMVAIFGTMAADIVHIVLGIPYIVSTISFSIALGIVLLVWYRVEKTLSIHSISTRRRELFYWLTVIATFALGTAAGDMTAATFGWGYLLSAAFFGILFFIPGIGYKFFKLNSIFAFWFAYIMTRPLGASFADWFGRTPDLGGIGFGTGKTSIVLALFIIFFVGYVSFRRHSFINNTISPLQESSV